MPALVSSVQTYAQSRLIDYSEEVSAEYRSFMVGAFADATRNHSKAIGQFLTPQSIYDSMVSDTIAALPLSTYPVLRAIDPFCGDGRLLTALVAALAQADVEVERLELYAWDIDESILEAARRAIVESGSKAPFDVEVFVSLTDAFFCDDGMLSTFDVVITNPPWSSAKSLKQRAFVCKEDYERYQQVANSYGRMLVERFPEVKGSRSFGAGALNLSRFGIALSVKLLNGLGICSIVMPSSFAADTSSAPLRECAFGRHHLRSLHYYPAEMKLFVGADQAAIYIVTAHDKASSNAVVVSHSKAGVKRYAASDEFWAYAAQNGWVVPLGYSEEELALILKLASCPTLSMTKSISLGREVDETRINERLCEESPYRFVKGFMVSCFQLSEKDKWYYDTERATIPPSALGEKVVWRDVSRVSQKKRVQATLLPPGHVAGNSLGVATCEDPVLLRAFLGVLNSSVFEFMARTLLTTNHVSSGTLKRLPFPQLEREVMADLAATVEEALSNPKDIRTRQRIERLVASAYNLSEEELETAQRAIGADGQLVLQLQESK